MATQLPDAILWLADTVLCRVRADQHELKAGDEGVAVARLQAALFFWGLYRRAVPTNLLPAYGCDGHFGGETKEALKDFQRANADATGTPLAADGILGDLTLGALDRMVTAPAPPSGEPAPEDDGALLTVKVDMTVFDDGPPAEKMAEMLSVANLVLGKAGIRVEPGRVRNGRMLAQSAAVDALARRVFDVNRADGGTRSRVSDATAVGRKMTPEVGRLRSQAPAGRLAAYFTCQFPAGVSEAAGVTYTTESFGISPLVIVADSYDCVDVFWHELGHALLDTDLETEDHDSDTIMTRKPTPAARKLPVSDGERRRMRATARRLG
ncbi:MAG: peptidoglycan-binding domain-containing protein [Gemmataceae bacterium]